MAAQRRSQAPDKPLTMPIMLAAVAAAGYGIYSGYPGLAAIWVGLIACAWTHPRAVFSGKKDSRGYPSPGSPGEQSAMNKSMFWEDLKFKLVIPGRGWMPGLKPQLSWLLAIWCAAAAFLIPVSDPYTAEYGPWINAAAIFIVIAQTYASRRDTQTPGDRSPGVSVDALIRLAGKEPGKVVGLTFGGLAVGSALGIVSTVMVPVLTTALEIDPVPEPALWALSLSIGILAVLSGPWKTEALSHWKIVVAARSEWDQRWTMLKQDPAPRLIDRQEVGPATVDTFDAPPAAGAMAYWSMGPKIGPTLGTGSKFAVLSTPNLDSQGQPQPGTRNPIRFDISQWPSDAIPDISDPSVPIDIVRELSRCALVWGADVSGAGRPILNDVHLLSSTEPVPADTTEAGAVEAAAPSPAVWALTWFLPDGPPASHIRTVMSPDIADGLAAEVLVDHRHQKGLGCLYAGALFDERTQWAEGTGINAATMEELDRENTWDRRWTEVMKQGSNPPTVQAPTARSARLADGTEIETISFVTRQGMTPSMFWPFESALPTVMDAAPFVSLTGYPGENKRPGERHTQAFSIYWSHSPVPGKPEDVVPVPRSNAPRWVLAALMNKGFKAARLADRPEVVNVRCLTKPDSRKHIWRVDLRLYGGVTLAEVRGMSQKIRQDWGSEWLRVAAAPDGCTIIAGAKPSNATIASDRDAAYVAALDWDQAFLDSKVSGVGGFMPVLKTVSTLPKNTQVNVFEFDLPPGLDFPTVRGATEKIKAATDNVFVDVQRGSSASGIRILTCPENPLPARVDFDFAAVDASGPLIPFATGIEGEAIMFDPITSPHALLAGVTRSGKSVLAQGFVYGMLSKGASVFIIDPMKAAADFTFAKDYASGMATDIYEAAATLKAVYKIVTERKMINSRMGVGSYHELADPPPPLVVLIDEFTSLMQKETVPPASDDPEEEILREELVALNRAKQEIGTFTGKLAREAASAGVNLLLGTQKLSAKMLDTVPGGGDLKTNLARTLLGSTSSGDRMSALRDFDSAPPVGSPIPKGRGLWEPLDHSAVVIQTWYASQDELRAALAERIPMMDPADKPDISAYIRRPKQEPVDAESFTAAPETSIVDLGELELVLDDLGPADFQIEPAPTERNDDERNVEEPFPDAEAPQEDPEAASGANASDPVPAPLDPWAGGGIELPDLMDLNDEVPAVPEHTIEDDPFAPSARVPRRKVSIPEDDDPFA